MPAYQSNLHLGQTSSPPAVIQHLLLYHGSDIERK
jgi:hypothetical protein